MRKLLAAALLLPSLAFAACPGAPGERWRGDDKLHHLAVGALIGVAVTSYSASPWQGLAWGAGVSIANELIDSTGMGTCSHKDALVGVLGAAIGVGGGMLILRHGNGRTFVGATWEFK